MTMFGFRHPSDEIRQEAFVEEALRQEGMFGGSRIVLTTDPTHPGLRELQPNLQQVAYLVLPDEEIELGLVRPLRQSYQHIVCEAVTQIGPAIAATFARRPSFYDYTFCAQCRRHFALMEFDESTMIARHQFYWEDGTAVGT